MALALRWCPPKCPIRDDIALVVAPMPRSLFRTPFALSSNGATRPMMLLAIDPPGMKFVQIGAVLTASLARGLMSLNDRAVIFFSFLNSPTEAPSALPFQRPIECEVQLSRLCAVLAGFPHSFTFGPVIESIMQISDIRAKNAQKVREAFLFAVAGEEERDNRSAEDVRPERRIH